MIFPKSDEALLRMAALAGKSLGWRPREGSRVLVLRTWKKRPPMVRQAKVLKCWDPSNGYGKADLPWIRLELGREVVWEEIQNILPDTPQWRARAVPDPRRRP